MDGLLIPILQSGYPDSSLAHTRPSGPIPDESFAKLSGLSHFQKSPRSDANDGGGPNRPFLRIFPYLADIFSKIVVKARSFG